MAWKQQHRQGYPLAAPGCPWCLTFAPGQLENLSFLKKPYAWHPGFHGFRALGSFNFFFEHSLDKTAKMATNDTKMVKNAITTMKHTNRDKASFPNM